MTPRLSRALQVALAARAEARRIHVGAVVPAALAFRMGARPDLDLDARAGFLRDRRARRDENEPQFVSEARQRVIHRPARADVEFRREGGADLLRFAPLLDFLHRHFATLAHAAPGGER